MKKISLTSALVLILSFSLFAGDSARFVNLGFSGNGSSFMFAQYGYNESKGTAYSDLYLVDVIKNKFISSGVKHGEYACTIEAGQSPDGALYNLLEEVQSVRKRYGISYLSKGRPLYIRIAAAEEADGEEDLSFRDFESDTAYSVQLNQSADEQNGTTVSSFSINLELERRDGVVKKYTVGHPNYKRAGIKGYQINRILLSPGEKNLVFIIQKEDVDLNIRYMIETVALK